MKSDFTQFYNHYLSPSASSSSLYYNNDSHGSSHDFSTGMHNFKNASSPTSFTFCPFSFILCNLILFSSFPGTLVRMCTQVATPLIIIIKIIIIIIILIIIIIITIISRNGQEIPLHKSKQSLLLFFALRELLRDSAQINFKIIVKLSWVWKVAHLRAVNTGLPTGENALQYAWSLSLNIICALA